MFDRFLDALARYFRLEVSGLGNIPEVGPAVLIANHSGVLAADAVLLAHAIRRARGRKVRIMAHEAYFRLGEQLREFSFHAGLREPEVEAALRTLSDGHLLLIFPEGEAGNFKSSLKRYQLQAFHSGFVRIAAAAGAPIIRCLVVGAEEANLSLGSLSLDRFRKHLRIPLPLNLIPLPSKWKIRITRPVTLPEGLTEDSVEEISAMTREQMQTELGVMISSRKRVYFAR